jgi:uncharacterized membrane protein YcfT
VPGLALARPVWPLFLFRVIDRDWRIYLDRKVVHFAYFYMLWLVILTVVKHGAELGADPTAFGPPPLRMR